MSESKEPTITIPEERITRNRMNLVRFAMNDLEVEQPGREAFSEDEIALRAMRYHPHYMKRKRALRRGKVPSTFRLPVMSEGFMELKSRGEIGCRFEDDEGNVVYDQHNPVYTKKNKPKNLDSYNRMYYTIRVAEDETPINAAQNGNGALPVDEIPQAFIDDVRNTS